MLCLPLSLKPNKYWDTHTGCERFLSNGCNHSRKFCVGSLMKTTFSGTYNKQRRFCVQVCSSARRLLSLFPAGAPCSSFPDFLEDSKCTLEHGSAGWRQSCHETQWVPVTIYQWQAKRNIWDW